MEGPSLYLAAQQLAPFKGKTVLRATGSAQVGHERLVGQPVKDIFSWGKHLVYQFPSFAIRIHFLMFGSFDATVAGDSVTGRVKRKPRIPKLTLTFPNGHVDNYLCAIRLIESAQAKRAYDFSIDLMSKQWDPKKAIQTLASHPKTEVADLLLDQTIFAGLGNMMKNETLFLAGIKPTTKAGDLPLRKRKELVERAKLYAHQFYAWRKKFVLLKHLQVHRKFACPSCGGKLVRVKTGALDRWSYYCEKDQPF